MGFNLKRYWVVWGGCVGVFLFGGLFSFAIFGVSPREGFRLIDFFSVLSAVATAVAAFAAWRAASAAQKQSFDAALSGRRQMYRMHFESFNEWLDGIQEDQKVCFYRRHELYESIFPSNRNPSLAFSEVGDAEISAWERSFKNLADLACTSSTPTRREVSTWVGEYMILSGFMRYTLLDPDLDQILLSGELRSGLSRENYEVALRVMSIVLGSMADFAFVNYSPAFRGITSEFKEAYIEFVDAVQIHGWHQHRYG